MRNGFVFLETVHLQWFFILRAVVFVTVEAAVPFLVASIKRFTA
jgi:hypothetical protein